MKEYEIYFEVFGKKMKTKVYGENEEKAKKQVLSKVIFHKVAKAKSDFNKAADVFDNIMNILKQTA